MTFNNANDAFAYYFNKISAEGIPIENTRALLNQGFYISDPLDHLITEGHRKWSKNYAEFEWEWYLSENRSVSEIKKRAKIWDTMHGGDDIVNSNYGYQWNRNGQLAAIIRELRENPTTRRAYLTIYDAKEKDQYEFDTPCTLSIGFSIIDGKLNMSVHMRSNDLWYGFCNDQYCFSLLQRLVADKLEMEVGWYHHFANNLHLYDGFYDLTAIKSKKEVFVIVNTQTGLVQEVFDNHEKAWKFIETSKSSLMILTREVE